MTNGSYRCYGIRRSAAGRARPYHLVWWQKHYEWHFNAVGSPVFYVTKRAQS